MSVFVSALLGGVLIGFSALLMIMLLGRITGISGIFAGVITADSGIWRWSFLAGLLGGPFVYHIVSNTAAPAVSVAGWPLIIAAGLLVGFGTRYAGGCTSGHAVCGIGRLSPRSIAATAMFMVTGMLTVTVVRHLLWGAS